MNSSRRTRSTGGPGLLSASTTLEPLPPTPLTTSPSKTLSARKPQQQQLPPIPQQGAVVDASSESLASNKPQETNTPIRRNRSNSCNVPLSSSSPQKSSVKDVSVQTSKSLEKLKQNEEEDEKVTKIEEPTITITSPPVMLPPIKEKHPLFLDSIPRIKLVEIELAVSLSELWHHCWSGKTPLMEQVAKKIQHADLSFTQWVEPDIPGCWKRTANWVIDLDYAIGPPKSQIVQNQRARLVNPQQLEVEISSRSQGVPFCESFSWEERWKVTSSGPSSVKLVIEGLSHWNNVPWSAAMLRSTIDKKSIETAKHDLGITIDLIEPSALASRLSSSLAKQQEPVVVIEGPPSHLDAASKGKQPEEEGVEEEQQEQQQQQQQQSFVQRAATLQKVIPPPTTVKQRQEGIVDKIANKLGTHPQNVNAAVLFMIVVSLILIVPPLMSMSSRLSTLEGQLSLSQLTESASERVAFLEYFLSQLTRNLTGDPKVVSNYYQLWKNTYALEKRLDEWRKEIDMLQQILHIESNSFTSLFVDDDDDNYDSSESHRRAFFELIKEQQQRPKGDHGGWSWVLAGTFLFSLGIVGGAFVFRSH